MHVEEFWCQLEHGHNVSSSVHIKALVITFSKLSLVYLQIIFVFNQESILQYLRWSKDKLSIVTLYIWLRFTAKWV